MMRFRPTTYAFSTLLRRFTCIHLLKAHLTLYRAFSLSVHHSGFTAFAAQSGLVTPPVQRYRYFATGSTPVVVSSLLQHVKERQSFFIFSAQAMNAKMSSPQSKKKSCMIFFLASLKSSVCLRSLKSKFSIGNGHPILLSFID